MASEAGLAPESAFDADWSFEFADEEGLGRAMMAPAGVAELVGPEREAEVRAKIVEGLAPFRGEDGVFRLGNEYHYLVARA